MTQQSLPTRSQLNGAMEFFASYAGSAYDERGLVELETDLTLQALRGQIVVQEDRTTICLPEGVVQRYLETWLRANWREIVDGMIDSHYALDDTIEDKQCPKTVAHGEHYWDASQFQDHFGPAGGKLIEWHCDGIKAHPRCMIMGGRDADA